jgi:urease accessory protein UreE
MTTTQEAKQRKEIVLERIESRKRKKRWQTRQGRQLMAL